MKKALSVLFCLLMIAMTAMPAFADDAKTITEVRLSVTEPAVGEKPDKTIVSAEPEKYTADYRYWIKRMHADDPVDAFEADCEYALVFYVTPAEGYTFAAVNNQESATVVYVNGQKALRVSAESETQLGRAYIVTPAANEEKPVSFFQRILNAIKDFFARIAAFFKKLFGIK